MVKTQLTSNIYLCHSYLNWYLFKWHQEFNHVYMWQRNISLLCFLFMFGVDVGPLTLSGTQHKLTPHVVMTGSLKTLQHSWQHSFTDGCSANTWGSCTKTHTHLFICSACGVVSAPELSCDCVSICLCLLTCMLYMFCVGRHTVSSSSSCREKVERRDMLDSEWRDRTEMAESDLRGVPMGGWRDRRKQEVTIFYQNTSRYVGYGAFPSL